MVLQKASKTHPFVPSAKCTHKACDMITTHLEIPNLLWDSDEAISKREDFANDYGKTCCKAFNHACTHAQQQVRKEIMVPLACSQNWDQEVPTSDEIKEMCLRTYDLSSDENQKKLCSTWTSFCKHVPEVGSICPLFVVLFTKIF